MRDGRTVEWIMDESGSAGAPRTQRGRAGGRTGARIMESESETLAPIYRPTEAAWPFGQEGWKKERITAAWPAGKLLVASSTHGRFSTAQACRPPVLLG